MHQIFAFLYDNTGDSPKAVLEFSTAINLAERVDNKEELSLDYMTLGTLYMSANKLDSALILEKKAQRYALESNYKIYLGFILNSIGDTHFLKNDHDSAAIYYSDALAASTEQKNLKDQINAFLNIAALKKTTGQPDSSLYYSKKALATSQLFGVPFGIRNAYNSILKVGQSRVNASDTQRGE